MTCLKKIFLLFSSLIFGGVCFLPTVVEAQGIVDQIVETAGRPGTVDEQIKIIGEPTNQIKIPGLKYSEITQVEENDGTYLYIPFLGEYLAVVYRYLVVLAGVISVIVIIVAGIQWTASGGNSSVIDSAKTRIMGALTGLGLAVGSYVILYTINPDLVSFKSLKVKYIVPEPVEYVESPDTEEGNSSLDIAQAGILYAPPTSQIYCPKSGGVAEIEKIITSLQGRVTYRYGGKHWKKPPYQETKGNEQFGSFCPIGTYCLDCSGFISFVYHCAKLTISGGAGNMLNGTTLLNTKDNPINFKNAIVDGIALKPGDILGWMGADPMEGNIGHVILYVGTIDGKQHQIAESSGGQVGRGPGANPRIRSFSLLEQNYFPTMKKKDGGPRYYRIKRINAQ